MIKATFYKHKGFIRGFVINGHSGYDEEGKDVICASVSSAAYMTANTLTEIVGIDANIMVDEGYMRLVLDSKDEKAQVVLKGLELHISTLAQDYSDFILCEEIIL
ncbi:MAG: ribosomal-processing cysteine protease Prp [Clostridia bacterium]|nr:ribosomal-processing cysteine protease Prp [Clostridia bacterium]